MSVAEVRTSSAGSSAVVKGTDASSAMTNYRANFRVRCNDPSDTADIVRDHFRANIGLPFNGRPFDFGNGYDAKAKCTELQIDTVEKSGGWFLVEAAFEETGLTVSDLPSKDGNPNEPFKWHDKLVVGSTQISMVVEEAIFRGTDPPEAVGQRMAANIGKIIPVMGANAKPLVPGIEEERDILTFKLTKYQPVYNAAFVNDFLGTINSNVFFILKDAYKFYVIVKPYKAKMKAINSSFHVTPKGTPYWEHELEIHINPFGWIRRLANVGDDELLFVGKKFRNGENVGSQHMPYGAGSSGSSDSPHSYTWEVPQDPNGVPIRGPIALNGDGRQLAAGEPFSWLLYQTLRETEWSTVFW